MAHLTTSDGINLLTGALKKHKNNQSSITRVKPVIDPITGEKVGHGHNELYIKEPRDYNLHPRTVGETRQLSKWTTACREASVIIHDKSHPRYMEFYHRWREHVSITERPMQFPNFIRAELSKEA